MGSQVSSFLSKIHRLIGGLHCSGALGGPSGIPVFTSDYLTKGYTFAGRMVPEFYPSGYGVEDLGLAVIDGKGYVTWTGFNLTAVFTQPPPGDVSQLRYSFPSPQRIGTFANGGSEILSDLASFHPNSCCARIDSGLFERDWKGISSD